MHGLKPLIVKRFSYLFLAMIPLVLLSTNKPLSHKHRVETSLASLTEEMVYIEGGTFEMGQPDPNIPHTGWSKNEQPVHRVTLPGFYISKYELTNERYCLFLNDVVKGVEEEDLTWGAMEYKDKKDREEVDEWMGLEEDRCRIYYSGGRYRVERGFERHPVVSISWYGAQAYCEWLSEKTGDAWRLPTEAEWEYAARGGQNYTYAGSNDLDEVGWYRSNSGNRTHSVGKKRANGFGLYDMSGNVWEWCQDCYNDSYYGAPDDGSARLTGACDWRVLRGGSWYSIDYYCRVANRSGLNSSNRYHFVGFRLARD